MKVVGLDKQGGFERYLETGRMERQERGRGMGTHLSGFAIH